MFNPRQWFRMACLHAMQRPPPEPRLPSGAAGGGSSTLDSGLSRRGYTTASNSLFLERTWGRSGWWSPR